jgi:hypothetical protein
LYIVLTTQAVKHSQALVGSQAVLLCQACQHSQQQQQQWQDLLQQQPNPPYQVLLLQQL